MKVMRIRRHFGLLMVSALALLVAAAGCGDDDGESTESGSDSTSSAGGSMGTGGTTNTGGTTGTGGNASNPELMDLFPLELNASWTYDVVMLGQGGVCGPGTYTMQVQSEEMLGGMNAFQLTSWCSSVSGSAPFGWDEATGDLMSYFNNVWRLNVANNVADGANFMANMLTYQWTAQGSVTVPAGTYENCWNLEQVGTLRYSTYCEGVGPVRHYADDGAGNGYDAQLTSSN